MTRALRLDTIIPHLPHHITFRGNNRRLLFSNATDRAAFVKYLVEAPYFAECAFHGCALLSNHGHLIATPTSQHALSECMRISCLRYAQRRNRERNGSGKVFEQRFFAAALETERHLAATLAYVDLNPERAGLGPRAAAWSTLGIHQHSAHEHPLRSLWTPCSWWLGLGKSDADRGAAYRDFVENRRAVWAADVVRGGSVDSREYTRRLTRPDGSWAR